ATSSPTPTGPVREATPDCRDRDERHGVRRDRFGRPTAVRPFPRRDETAAPRAVPRLFGRGRTTSRAVESATSSLFPRGWPQDETPGTCKGLPLRFFAGQLPAAERGQTVVACAFTFFRQVPRRGNPALRFEAMERGIHRAGFHLQQFFGGPLD